MRLKFRRKKPTSFTPDLLAYLLKDHIEKDFARHEEQLSNRQRFNLLLFYAWSYFSGTCTHVRFKGANPGAIKEALRESLVKAAAFIYHERIRKIAGKASLHTILSAIQEMHRDVGAPLGMTAAPVERAAFRGYLERAKALSPDNKSIQRMGEPSDMLGELLIAYRALADFVAWEIEEAEGTTTD